MTSQPLMHSQSLGSGLGGMQGGVGVGVGVGIEVGRGMESGRSVGMEVGSGRGAGAGAGGSAKMSHAAAALAAGLPPGGFPGVNEKGALLLCHAGYVWIWVFRSIGAIFRTPVSSAGFESHTNFEVGDRRCWQNGANGLCVGHYRSKNVSSMRRDGEV